MTCEKYKSRIADAADVGADFSPPSGIRDSELAAHLKTCSACRAEFESQLALIAAIDRGVAAMVNAEPSGDFAAHVRRRIEETTLAPRPWFAGWVPVTAAALALIVLVTFWVMRRTGPVPQPPEAARENAPATNVRRPPREPQMAEARPNVPVPPPVAGSRTIRPPREPQIAANREPEVLVPRGEVLVIARLLNANWSGKADGASLTSQPPPVSESLKPMTIEELKTPALEIVPLKRGEPPKGSPEK